MRYTRFIRGRARRAYWADYLLRRGQPIARTHVNGLQMYVDLRDEDGVGIPLYVNRAYEPKETELFRRILQPGMTFVDVGANIGYFTTLAAKLVAPGGRVIAVEPDLENFTLLQKNIEANSLCNTDLMNVALAAAPGSARLYRSHVNHGDYRLYCPEAFPQDSVEVKVETLDRALDTLKVDRVDIAKLDVQGYEVEVLEGMSRTIAANKGMVILSEYWPYGLKQAGRSARQFIELLQGAGFEPNILQEAGEVLAVDWREVDSHLPQFNPQSPGSAYVNLVLSRSKSESR